MKLSEELRSTIIQSALSGKLTAANKYQANEITGTEYPCAWEQNTISGVVKKLVDGTHNPPSKIADVTPYKMLSAQNVTSNGLVNIENGRSLTEKDFKTLDSRTKLSKGDLVLTCVGTIGRSCVIKNEISNITFQRSVSILTPGEKVMGLYLKYFFDSPAIQSYMVKNAKGTAQKGFYLKQVANLPISIPPIEEQQRIVDRVDELMAKVDELEKIEKELDSLESGFADELKASIIEAGFSGRLFNDGEISAVSEIKNELERLMNSKAFKVHKYQNDTLDDEPYDIPENWKWGYLGTTTTYAQTKVKASPEFLKEDHWLLDMEDIEKETGKVNQKKRTTSQKFKGEKLRFEAGDLLYSKLRPYLKKVLIADEDGACTSELVPVKPLNGLLPEYLCWYLRSPFVTRIANKESYGTKMPRVGVATMINIPVPIPSKNCQKHIVDKLNLVISRIEELQSLAKH